ncbi:tumor necrosis factor receptor superfamily member 13C isoform X1 [Peromyscus maniculatus bairdii]|uniref:tumor necrosis factor receptor superfamily member 13C isoform X1 n=1 Tax=Peromyscus maniculatus bairdii TaxID=230844 RepID=UPI00077DE2FF|nr:tumor necrosis factor receptor superfamily member 13C isoform X1 [Peromyscus maniculatus bairdii]
MDARKRRTRSRRNRDSPVPTPCVQTLCFDPLVRHCVACELLRTPDPPRHAFGPSVPRPPSASPSPSAPGTALQPQESVGMGPGTDATLPLPGLLFGAPALLGLVLLVLLVALVTWRWWQQRRMASPDIPDGVQEESLDNVYVSSPETLHASAPVWPTPKEDADTTLPGHSIPVPATELGSTELVTTKTAGPEE